MRDVGAMSNAVSICHRPMSDKGEVIDMVLTEARLNLERSYKIMVDAQNTFDKERQLDAAMHVIVAWEAVSDAVTVMCVDVIDAKGLTAQV